MRQTLQVVTPPAEEVVSPTLLAQHLRLDQLTTADQALLPIYSATARSLAEAYTNRCFITTGLLYSIAPGDASSRWATHWWRREIELPRSPLDAISEVTLTDIDGNATTIPSGGYLIDPTQSPARMRLDYTTGDVPTINAVQNIQIAFTAGYSADGSLTPPAAVNAILLTAAFLYERRGDDGGDMPAAARWLLDPLRVAYFGG